ncbi:MAG: transketolase family protein [Bacteroidales bacterium]|nr:transketolase family protein [Bacteroidales bacterium]
MEKYQKKSLRAPKIGFGEALLAAANRYSEIVGIGADITASVGMNLFAEKYPSRFFSLGIAEQNCVGVAAGLALAGKIPVFSTYAVFSALRATDQIRISLCYNKLHVIICGAHAGISVGPDGATHQALEDIGIMRTLPNMTVLSPCDAAQTYLAFNAAVEQCKGPVYLRYGREPIPEFTDINSGFIVGKAQLLKEGKDMSIIATGSMVWQALQAAYKLAEDGLDCRVINMHTIKPIDKDIIINAAKETCAIITVEEHQVNSGLGGAVAEVVVQNYPAPVSFIGMPDCFGESGKPEELLNKYGLTIENIIQTARKMIKNKLIV